MEDVDRDKTALYNLNATKGSWAVTMKVDNDEVWKDVKAGKYLGLSIEGMFSEPKEKIMTAEEAINEIKKMLN